MNENNAQADFRQEGEQQPLLFALDIGTRSVIGVLAVEENGLLRVLDVAVQEHAKRAMIDGQIEDIAQVAAVARSVREEIEVRQGVKLRRVCVAAAGRALKTIRCMSEITYEAQHVLTPRDVYELEMSAVEKARRKLLEENAESGDSIPFYCVGHAVVRYDLDGYTFSTVKGHKAEVAKVEIIATFLPGAVVESLYTAMEMAGLQVESVTLEPIAAMNAVIPQELRLLNLALVDVGAGTSDIAISESGSVAAYTMATTAGDEISEELIRTCLVDFETAERIKQACGNPENVQITYDNILGMPDTLVREDALARLRPAVETLANTICEKLKEANGGKTPTAVFLVGGGGKTPYLCELVAQGLGLEPGKVALGGNNLFKRLAVSSKEITGPEYATPLGIALTALGDESRESFFIKVNGRPVLAIYSKEMTALDVLLMAGYSYSDLMGRSGKGLEYRLDGQTCRERGERFIPATLHINERPAAVSDRVNRGDVMMMEPAVQGRDASLTVGQLAARLEDSFSVLMNGARCPLVRTLLKNGAPAEPTDEIMQDDELSFVPPTLGDVCGVWGLEPHDWLLFVNEELAALDRQLENGDSITWQESAGDRAAWESVVHADATQFSTVEIDIVQGGVAQVDAVEISAAEIDAEQTGAPQIRVVQIDAAQVGATEIGAAQVSVPQAGVSQAVPDVQQETDPAQVDSVQSDSVQPRVEAVLSHAASDRALAFTEPTVANSVAPGGLRVVLNGNTVVLPRRDTPYQFLDLLPLADLDFKKPQGDVLLLHNGREATYLDLIVNGDEAVIGWKPREL